MKKTILISILILIALLSSASVCFADTDTITFESFTAFENEECRITIMKIDPDNIRGYTIQTKLENKTADQNFIFSILTATVNGVEIDPFFATEITAGNTEIREISFSPFSLKDHDIGPFTDIELFFRVADADNWLAEHIVDRLSVHVYPYGAENAAVFARERMDSDLVLIDNELFSLLIIGFDDDPIWGYTANLYFENKTDKTIMVSFDQVSINGYLADPFFAKELLPETCAFTPLLWISPVFEIYDIQEVERIDLTITAYDSDNVCEGHIIDETITIHL